MIITLMSIIVYGSFFSFIIDFFFFLGIKFHYLDFYGVNVYFNPFFAYNENYLYFILKAIVLGFLYLQKAFINKVLFILIVLACVLPMIPKFGYELGSYIFYKKNFQEDKNGFSLDLIYDGKKKYFLIDTNTKELISIKK